MIPSVGDEVCVLVKGEFRGRGCAAGLPDLPDVWQCEFRPARKDGKVELLPGTWQIGWVFEVRHEQRRLVVTGRDRGFLPITRKMRSRYRSAISEMLGLFRSEKDGRAQVPLGGSAAGAASEVKGMYSRCFKRNQADWHAVWQVLGQPDDADASQHSELFGDLARSVRDESNRDTAALIARARNSSLPQVLEAALQLIDDGEMPLQRPRLMSSDAAHADGRSRERVPKRPIDWAKLDWANATHESLLERLVAYLTSHGVQAYANNHVDAFCELPGGECLIFEAKSISENNELAQVRSAVAQLYEYRYREQIKVATLWLVLSRRPIQESWLLRYLEVDRDIRVLWVEGGELAGPSLARLQHLVGEVPRAS